MSDTGLAPRLSIVTLGVANVQKARAFYEALGWQASSASREAITFFQLSGVVLALFERNALADDATVAPAGDGFRGVTLAHNVESEAAVDAALAHAVRSGARLVKPASKVFWGGYSGYFSDPDGHLWEVAYNPFISFDEAGRLILPGPEA
ncbi:VOC family protein [Kaistia dalseonensis]|uniref:Catechol 2,3-dioxygenase-like lactoylglutathione lyase family enzyme n=1 Tax=Kaistia dalseonensis TaxID=410840 RepID=A0ABU0H367_9HYPH|nr:VOC family protein [Kaistia dalseonensis]MCX5494147.1 VOC family protein [Kaistia dalseonensis]MDQ0436726.1 catechol 2,3-dioxygenase-like lactoylglutathione lyase family enzyme [Kaistia dalseonensis]